MPPLLLLLVGVWLSTAPLGTLAAAFQQSVQLANGVSALIEWMPANNANNDDGIAFTVTANTLSLGWLGFGVTSSTGLGTNLLLGGKDGAGALVGMKVNNQLTVREYAFTLPLLTAEPYSTEGMAMQDAMDCMSTYCQTQAQGCYTQSLCRTALTCASDKFSNELPSNITEESFDDLYQLFQPCVTPLSSPQVPEQNKALSLLLGAGSCFASSCSAKMLAISTRQPHVSSSSFTQNSTSSRLDFVLSQRQLGNANFSSASSPSQQLQTLFVMLGEPYSSSLPSPTERTKLSQPSTWATVTVNLATGKAERIALPGWLVLHIVLGVLGFAGVYALSLCMRRIPAKRKSWAAFAFTGLGLFVGVVGALVVSAGSGQKSDATDLHKVLSVLTIVLAVLVWVGGVYYDPLQASSSAWSRATVSSSEEAPSSSGSLFGCIYPGLELLALVGIAMACITGYTTVDASAHDSGGALILAVIVGCGLCGLSGLLILVLPVLSAWLCKRTTRRGGGGQLLGTKAATNKTTNASSANPVFADALEANTPPAAVVVAAEEQVVPMVLAWSGLSFSAPQRHGTNAGLARPIFANAVGVCSPRTLTCVLGPSGAGKSSLMDFLACRNAKPALPGSSITVNGLPVSQFPQLHRHIALVPQQDVLHQHLTVLETLQFSCEMILPADMHEQDKVDRMLRIVAQLGMGHVLDTLVGGDNVRGLSGGERRRVSIALQMIKSPSILFLDEPTSGLDAHMALTLCKVMRELANEGRTVLATVHQPSVACFELFDRVVVLSAGHTVYSGTRPGAMHFLRECNRDAPSAQWNPADWILTLVDANRDEQPATTAGKGNGARTEELLKHAKQNKSSSAAAAATFDEAMLRANVGLLREGVVAYYVEINPEKMVEDPTLVDEIVKYTVTRGVDAVENKLKTRYGASFLPFLSAAMQPALASTSTSSRSVEPCTREELEALVKRFYASRYHAELVDRIARVKDEMKGASQLLRVPATSVLSLISMSTDLAAAVAAGGAQDDTTTPTTTTANNNDGFHHAQPFMVQMKLLANRSFLLVWRNPQALRFQAVQNLVFGLLLGALYSNLEVLNSPFQVAFSMASILAMVAFVALSFGTQIGFQDRLVLEREMSDAMYSPYAHFMQRMMVGIPVAVFVAVCLIGPAYFLIGLKADGDSFFFFFLVNVAVVFTFDSIVFVLTLITSDMSTAHALGNFIEAMTVFFSGVFVPIYAMPDFLAWIYYLSPFSYAFGAVVQNEFLGSEDEYVIQLAGIMVPNQWANLVIVFAMGLVGRFVGLILLIQLFNQKRPGKSFSLNV